MTTQQPNLFGAPDVYGGFQAAPIRAAAGDPITSHEGAARLTKSGKVARHRQIALALVKTFPSRTGYELFQLATDEQRDELENVHELYRRLADLKNSGVLSQGEPRPCKIKKTRMVTWDLVGASQLTKKAVAT
jgi:hypothetical protein